MSVVLVIKSSILMGTLRNQLLLWLLVSASITGLVTGIITYQSSWTEFNRIRDNELAQVAYSIARHGMPAEENQAGLDRGEFVSEIWSADGTLQFCSPPDYPIPLQPHNGYSVVKAFGLDWRVYSMSMPNGVRIQVAHSFTARQAMLQSAAGRILLPVAVLLPLFGVLIWLVVRRNLRPLQRLAALLDQRAPNSNEMIILDRMPSELASVVQALNGLLTRMDAVLALQRQFIANAAHELNSPLTAVRLNAQLARQVQDSSTRDNHLLSLESAVDRAAHLVHQLLDLARAEPGTLRPSRKPVDLAVLARRCVTDYFNQADGKGIDLGATRLDPVIIQGDPDSLTMLLSNLITNAIRYTPRNGMIDVSVVNDGDGIVVSVADSGPGIDATELPRVFERFYRGSNHAEAGSGLGLAIVKAIAEQHGAEIRLENRPQGGLMASVIFHS